MTTTTTTRTARSRLRSLRPTTVAAVGILAVVVAAAMAAPLITQASPLVAHTDGVLHAPGAEYPLGGDSSGRDALARLLYGARTTLLGAAITTAVSILIGVPAGLLAGYRDGRVDRVVTWATQFLLALPVTVVLIVAIAIMGAGVCPVSLALGALLSPIFIRIVRGVVRTRRSEEFVDAARLMGASDLRIAVRTLLPFAVAPVLVQASLVFALAIVMQSSIDFLGLGLPSEPSWGAVLRDGYDEVYRAPFLLWPCVIGTVLVTLALGLLARDFGDRTTGASRTVRRRNSRRRHDRAAARVSVPSAVSSAPDDALVAVDALTIDYPGPTGHRRVLDGATLHIRRGEVLGLVGESGSGKTQIARSLLSLLAPEAEVVHSTVAAFGIEVLRAKPGALRALRGPRIGYVSQEPIANLDPTQTVEGHLLEALRRHRTLSRAAARRIAGNWLTQVGISDVERVLASRPFELSGGMAQRVLIAGALSLEPELLIADEPTTALDVTTQAEILDLIDRLRRDLGLTVLLVSHDLGVIADLADRVVVLQGGRVVETSPVDDFFTTPEAPYSRVLLAASRYPDSHRAPLSPALQQAGAGA